MAWFLAMPAKPAQNIEGRSPGLEVPMLAQSAVILAVALGVGLGASAFLLHQRSLREKTARATSAPRDAPSVSTNQSSGSHIRPGTKY